MEMAAIRNCCDKTKMHNMALLAMVVTAPTVPLLSSQRANDEAQSMYFKNVIFKRFD